MTTGPRRFAVRLAAFALVLVAGGLLLRRLTTMVRPGTTAAPSAQVDRQPVQQDVATSARPRGVGVRGVTTPEPDPRGAIPRGARTDWDGWGVGSPAVVEGADGRLHMWFRGCSFAGGEFACAIGHAASTNGIDWTKSPAAVIVPGDRIERRALNAIAAVRAGDRHYLWYSVDEDWSAGRPRPALYLATSADGLTWQHAGIVLEPDSADTLSINHTAVHDGAKFHLWFVDGEEMVHRSSSDGKRWTIDGVAPDADIVNHIDPGSLSVFRAATGTFEGIAADSQGHQFVHVASDDGNEWRVLDREPLELDPPPGTTATLAWRGNLWVWLSRRTRAGDREMISLAQMKRRP